MERRRQAAALQGASRQHFQSSEDPSQLSERVAAVGLDGVVIGLITISALNFRFPPKHNATRPAAQLSSAGKQACAAVLRKGAPPKYKNCLQITDKLLTFPDAKSAKLIYSEDPR